MNPLLLWRRLRPLLSLYQDLLGVSGMFKMLLSGFMLSLIELGGLALIFPFLKLVTDQDFYQHIVQQVEGMPLAYALEEHQRAVLVVGIGLVLVYIFRGWFSLYLVSYQASVAARTSIATSDNFVTKALASRYQLFLKHSPGKIAGVSHCNTTHVMLLFQSLSSGINEVILFSLVLSGLIFVSPAVFFGLAMLVLAVGLGLFRPIARRAATIGQRTKENDLGRYRFIVAVTNAIRDIKIMGLEASFTRCNRALSRKYANLAAEYASVSAVQRIAVEVVFACSVVVAAIWFAWVSGDLKESAPLLATVGLVAVRTVPVLSRLAGAYSGVRYSLPFVESLLEMHQELGNYQQHRQAQTVHFPGEYCATNLCFNYDRREVLIDCSLRISQGEIVAIVGPSGAGKSTLLDVLVGLQPPTSGSFTLNGVEFSPFLSANFPAYVGYVPQTITLLDSSLAFNIALEEEPDSERLQQSIECAGLAHLIDDLPQGLQTLLGEGGQGLSGGQRQRVGIARALYRKPALLILDEATSALDEAMARAIMAELLAMRGQISMIFVTHDLHLVPADRIYQLDQGRISAYTARNPSRYESAFSD